MSVRDLFIILLLVGLAMMFVSFAHGSPECMTVSEAREKYGSKWLYWHTEHHCWDDKKKNVRDWPHTRNETDNRSTDRKSDKSPSRAAVAGDAPPSDGLSPTDGSHHSIWPEPPTEAAFSYRWPDQDPMPSPLRWYFFYGFGAN